MHDKDFPYEVGYRKPPQSGQFAKGKSGNPKGRPKGSKNLASVVLRESRRTVRVKGPRGNRNITMLEASVMQLGNQSAQGNLRAIREFSALVERSEESMNSDAAPLKFHEMDQQVMESILQRMQSLQSNNDESTTEGMK